MKRFNEYIDRLTEAHSPSRPNHHHVILKSMGFDHRKTKDSYGNTVTEYSKKGDHHAEVKKALVAGGYDHYKEAPEHGGYEYHAKQYGNDESPHDHMIYRSDSPTHTVYHHHIEYK